MDQAIFVDNDSSRSESEISRIATTRRVQVKSFFAGARAGVSSFFTNAVVSIQKFISERQAEIIAAATSAINWLRTAIAAALQAVRNLITLARVRVSQLIERLKTSLQTKVKTITGHIIDLIDSIPFPDVPGIGWIRSRAVALLNQAAGFVNRALSGLLGLIQAALDSALRLIDSLVGLLASALDAALALVLRAIVSIVQMVGAALRNTVAIIGNILRLALLAVLVPLFILIEGLIVGVIIAAEQGARALVRMNREQYLGALADAVIPRAPPPGARAVSEASQIAVMRQLGRDAAENNRRIVQTFAFVMGGAITTIVRVVTTVISRIFAAVSAALAAIFRAIVFLIRLAIKIITDAINAYVEFIREVIRSLVTWLEGIYEEVRSWIEGGIDRFIEFAEDVVNRVGRFVSRFVRNLISGRGVGESLRDALGEFRGARYVPSFRGPPPPPPHVIITILLAIFVAIVGLLGGTVVIAGGVVIIFIFGATYTIPVAVAVAIVVVLLAIVALIIWLIIRWLTKPKPGPGKRVIFVTPSAAELGVGGRDIRGTATIAPGTPARPPLTWTINPGGAIPLGVIILGSGRVVRVRANHPPPPTVTGGAPITIRAALTANPADFADSAPVMIVQVVSATYAAVPPLVPVPITTPGFVPPNPPPNTAEPNRDGIAGNTATVNSVTAPAGRVPRVTFRRSLGATVAGTTITPGTRTGDIRLRLTDPPTDARLDEAKPSTVGPAARMAELTVNAVPTNVTALTFSGRHPAGPYSALNRITFAFSDTLHPPVQRIVGELITHVADDFTLPAPNGAFNPGFRFDLAVPANLWLDLLLAAAGALMPGTAQVAIDVNRFVGPGAPGLPRRVVYRQRMLYSSWQGAGAVLSSVFADGEHRKFLTGSPAAGFQFTIEHVLGSGRSRAPAEPYAGPALIILSNVVVTQNLPGATALAADGAATAELGVTSNVAGGSVNWSVQSGDIAIIAGNPAALPATATVRAGVRTGNFTVRARDTIFPNRQIDGRVRVEAVALRSMRAAPNPVPSGTLSTDVSLNANPGGRTVNWVVDPAAAAAGVTVTPNVTGPGAPAMTVRVTRPAGFTGTVTVTATDSVLATANNSIRVRFR